MKRKNTGNAPFSDLSTILASFMILTIVGCAESNREFTFVQMCDPQIRVGEDDSFFRVEGTVERFETAIRQINALDPDFVVICGDFVQRSNDSSFTAYRKLTNRIHVPVHAIPGNHDYNPSRGDERPTAERIELYRDYFGDDYFDFVHGGMAFILINTPLFLAKDGGEKWGVEPFEGAVREAYQKQDAWLRSTLQRYAKMRKPIFIVGHHPLHPDMPGLAPGVLPVSMRKELFDLFEESGVVAVLGGHGHKTFIQEYDGIALVHGHTTSFILERDAEKRKAFGFRLWTVHADGTFNHEYIPLDPTWQELME